MSTNDTTNDDLESETTTDSTTDSTTEGQSETESQTTNTASDTSTTEPAEETSGGQPPASDGTTAETQSTEFDGAAGAGTSAQTDDLPEQYRDQARTLRQETASELDRYAASDLRVVTDDGQLVTEVKDTARERELREQAASQSEQFDPTDFTVKQGEDGVRARVSEPALREQAAQQSEQYEPDDFTIAETEDGARARVRDQALREQAASQSEQFDPQDFDVTGSGSDRTARVDEQALLEETASELERYSQDDLRVVSEDGQLRATPTETARKRELREQAASQSEQFGPSDFAISETDEGLQATVSEQARRRELEDAYREQVASQYEGVETEDVSVSIPELSEEAQQFDQNSDGQFSPAERQRAIAANNDGEISDQTLTEVRQAAQQDIVSLDDDARKQVAAENSDLSADVLQIDDDGEVAVKQPDRSGEMVSVSLGLANDAPPSAPDSDPTGDVAWVGPDGERVETGVEANWTDEDPYFARVDVPEGTEGEWRLQVGGETVATADVGPAEAQFDLPDRRLQRGWNGNIITVEDGEAQLAQSDYNPDERRTPASVDEDVVAGAGAAEALQAGVEPEQLSEINPISQAQGERIAAQMEQAETSQPEVSAPENIADADQNQQLREQIAADIENVSAEDLDIVATGSGPEVVGPGGSVISSVGSGGGAPGRQATDATFDGSRSVGDESTGAGVTAELEDAREEARQNAAAQSDRLSPEDIETSVEDGRVSAQPEESALRRIARQDVAGQSEYLSPEDIETTVEDGEVTAQPEQAALERAARQQTAAQFENVEPNEVETSVEDGRVETSLTEDARQPEAINDGRWDRYAAGVGVIGDTLAGSTDEAVGRAVDAAREGDVAGVGDALAGSADERVGRATAELADGDVTGAIDEYAGQVDESVSGLDSTAEVGSAAVEAAQDAMAETETDDSPLPGEIGAADEAGRAVGEIISDAELDRDVTDPVTRGGLLDEEDEQRLSEASAQYSADATAAADTAASVSPLTQVERVRDAAFDAAGVDEVEASVESPVGEVTFDSERDGEGNLERTQEAAGEKVLGLGNVFAGAQAAETGVEVAENAPETTGEAAALGAAGAAITRKTGETVVEDARTDPTRFAGGVAGELLVGYGASKAVRGVSSRASSGIRVDSADLPTESGTTTYRGVSIETPGSSGPRPVVGATGWRPRLGTPRVDIEGDALGSRSGYAPETDLETEIVTSNLKRQLDDPDRTRLESAMEIQRTLNRQGVTDRTAATAEEAIREADQIPDPAAGEVADYLRDNDVALGGSAGQLAQIGRSRTPDDIDVYTDTPAQTESDLQNIIQQYTDEDLDTRSGGGVVNEAGEHVVDVNEMERATGLKDFGGAQFGIETTDDGVPIQPVESQIAAKVEGATRIRGSGGQPFGGTERWAREGRARPKPNSRRVGPRAT